MGAKPRVSKGPWAVMGAFRSNMRDSKRRDHRGSAGMRAGGEDRKVKVLLIAQGLWHAVLEVLHSHAPDIGSMALGTDGQV